MASTADLITGTQPKMAIAKGLRQSTESTFPANPQMIQAVVIVWFLILFFHNSRQLFKKITKTMVVAVLSLESMVSTFGNVMP